jgi:P27 family predicted phage terminase small subunit
MKLVGGNPGRRPLNLAEPQPARGRPRAPKHLSVTARKAWRHLAPLLERMGVLTEVDGVALELLAEAYADYLGAQATLKAFGSNIYETKNESGSVMYRTHPATAIMQDADRRIRAWCAEFGLTPSARTRVKGEPPRKNDPAEKYLDR